MQADFSKFAVHGSICQFSNCNVFRVCAILGVMEMLLESVGFVKRIPDQEPMPLFFCFVFLPPPLVIPLLPSAVV